MSPPIGGVRAGYLSAGKDAIPDSGNLQSDYNADSFNLNDNDTITSSWTDSEGNFDASVNGDPTFNANAQNGEPAVDLDTSDYFDTGFTQDTGNPRTLYIVWFDASTSADKTPYGAIDSSESTARNYLQSLGGNNDEPVTAYGDTVSVGANAGATGQWLIWSGVAGSGSHELFENGSSVVSGSFSANGSVGFSDYIGANNFDGSATKESGGQIARILRYNVKHDATTRGKVEDYLNGIYAVF